MVPLIIFNDSHMSKVTLKSKQVNKYTRFIAEKHKDSTFDKAKLCRSCLDNFNFMKSMKHVQINGNKETSRFIITRPES